MILKTTPNNLQPIFVGSFSNKNFISISVSASFVPGTESNTGRQRHAPLYGRLVPEEHLPATHRDVVHQVN